MKIGKGIELSVQGLGIIEILTVPTGPEERLVLHDLQAAQINVARLEKSDMLLRKVSADHRYHVDAIVETGGG